MATPRYKVALGFPGTRMHFAAHLAIEQATDDRHDVQEIWSPLGAWDAFNCLWIDALNMSEAGEADLYALIHSDSDPEAFWLDTCIDELERTGADWVSVISPIKDGRGRADLAIGDPADRWNPLRIFTFHELMKLPETLDAAALGYPGQCLLQGDGCMVADLRKEVFHRVDSAGLAQVCFNFPTQVLRGVDGKWTRCRESEDWYFSRRLFEAGGRAIATRKVALGHIGDWTFRNNRAWGTSTDGDDETRVKWDHSGTVIHPHGFWVKDEARYHRHDPALSSALQEFLLAEAKTAVDFGCGRGRYVADLRAVGIQAEGYDGSPHTPDLSFGLCGVRDLAEPFDVGRRDWVLCLEVAEHVPEKFERLLVDNLVRHAAVGIILSWCRPGEGSGHGHYNERPESYVRALMAGRGFAVDDRATASLREKAVLPWFKANLLVFRRAA